MDSSHGSGEDLQRLLALKRHEQPPPGYFDYLHHQVVNRIALDDEVEPEDWFGALWDRLRLRPALVGAFSFALGAFYLAGMGRSDRLAPRPPEQPWQTQRWIALERRPPIAWHPWATPLAVREAHASSTTPVIQAGPGPSILPLVHPLAPATAAPAVSLPSVR